MKKIVAAFSILLCSCTATQVTQAVTEAEQILTGKDPLTTDQVGEGLKEALTQGIAKGSDVLSQVDGYFKNPEIKIPFPPDAKKVEDKLRAIGLGNDVDKFIMTLNRGAEDAAIKAKPIFVDAIKQMTIEDAWGILKGQPDAATQYLKKTTTTQLQAQFKPVIQSSLDKVNATKYYSDLVNTYNKIPFIEKVKPDLNAYATDLAIRGLFTTVANEEKNIRSNPVARTTDLLKKVFAAQK